MDVDAPSSSPPPPPPIVANPWIHENSALHELGVILKVHDHDLNDRLAPVTVDVLILSDEDELNLLFTTANIAGAYDTKVAFIDDKRNHHCVVRRRGIFPVWSPFFLQHMYALKRRTNDDTVDAEGCLMEFDYYLNCHVRLVNAHGPVDDHLVETMKNFRNAIVFDHERMIQYLVHCGAMDQYFASPSANAASAAAAAHPMTAAERCSRTRPILHHALALIACQYNDNNLGHKPTYEQLVETLGSDCRVRVGDFDSINIHWFVSARFGYRPHGYACHNELLKLNAKFATDLAARFLSQAAPLEMFFLRSLNRQLLSHFVTDFDPERTFALCLAPTALRDAVAVKRLTEGYTHLCCASKLYRPLLDSLVRGVECELVSALLMKAGVLRYFPPGESKFHSAELLIPSATTDRAAWLGGLGMLLSQSLFPQPICERTDNTHNIICFHFVKQECYDISVGLRYYLRAPHEALFRNSKHQKLAQSVDGSVAAAASDLSASEPAGSRRKLTHSVNVDTQSGDDFLAALSRSITDPPPGSEPPPMSWEQQMEMQQYEQLECARHELGTLAMMLEMPSVTGDTEKSLLLQSFQLLLPTRFEAQIIRLTTHVNKSRALSTGHTHPVVIVMDASTRTLRQANSVFLSPFLYRKQISEYQAAFVETLVILDAQVISLTLFNDMMQYFPCMRRVVLVCEHNWRGGSIPSQCLVDDQRKAPLHYGRLVETVVSAGTRFQCGTQRDPMQHDFRLEALVHLLHENGSNAPSGLELVDISTDDALKTWLFLQHIDPLVLQTEPAAAAAASRKLFEYQSSLTSVWVVAQRGSAPVPQRELCKRVVQCVDALFTDIDESMNEERRLAMWRQLPWFSQLKRQSNNTNNNGSEIFALGDVIRFNHPGFISNKVHVMGHQQSGTASTSAEPSSSASLHRIVQMDLTRSRGDSFSSSGSMRINEFDARDVTALATKLAVGVHSGAFHEGAKTQFYLVIYTEPLDRLAKMTGEMKSFLITLYSDMRRVPVPFTHSIFVDIHRLNSLHQVDHVFLLHDPETSSGFGDVTEALKHAQCRFTILSTDLAVLDTLPARWYNEYNYPDKECRERYTPTMSALREHLGFLMHPTAVHNKHAARNRQ